MSANTENISAEMSVQLDLVNFWDTTEIILLHEENLTQSLLSTSKDLNKKQKKQRLDSVLFSIFWYFS